LDWEAPLRDKGVDAPRCVSTSARRDERRHQPGHLQPHLLEHHTPEPPPLGLRRRGRPLGDSEGPRRGPGQRIRGRAPPEPNRRRRRPPSPKAAPAPPLPPQQLRPAHTHAHLIYTPGSVDSPPSRRQGGRRRARNPTNRRRLTGAHGNAQKSPSLYCRWGKGVGPTRQSSYDVLVHFTGAKKRRADL
jgi:hypothetical protein